MKKLIILTLLITSSVASIAQKDNQYKTTLKKLMEVSGSEQTFKAVISQFFTLFKNQNSQVPDSIWSELEQEFYNTSTDELVAMLTPVYEKHLTEADLQKIIEFYQSPVGKKYAEKTPFITQESMQVGQQWGTKIGEHFAERLKQNGY
jgi:uncharacterized protein